MIAIREILKRGMEKLEDALQNESGETQKLTLPSGAQLPCVPASLESWSDVAQYGPQLEGLAHAVLVRKELFITVDSSLITVDSEITIDDDTPRLRSGKKPSKGGKTYRVLKVSEDPSGAYFKIFLGSAK